MYKRQEQRAAEHEEEEYYYTDALAAPMNYWEAGDFCVTEDGIIFFWQEYTLGPAIVGAQQFEVGFSQIADILDGRLESK